VLKFSIMLVRTLIVLVATCLLGFSMTVFVVIFIVQTFQITPDSANANHIALISMLIIFPITYYLMLKTVRKII